MKPSGIALGGAAALVLAGAAVVAVAQPAPPAAPNAPEVRRERQVIIRRGPGVPERFEMRRGGPGRGDRLMVRRSPEDRAERLRTLLQLTPAQDRALQAFVTATAPPERDVLQPAVARGEPQTAVERADRMAEATARMAAETKKRADATRAFYAALTPSQRKVFDATAGVGGQRTMRIRRMRGDGVPPAPPRPPAPPAPPRAG